MPHSLEHTSVGNQIERCSYRNEIIHNKTVLVRARTRFKITAASTYAESIPTRELVRVRASSSIDAKCDRSMQTQTRVHDDDHDHCFCDGCLTKRRGVVGLIVTKLGVWRISTVKKRILLRQHRTNIKSGVAHFSQLALSYSAPSEIALCTVALHCCCRDIVPPSVDRCSQPSAARTNTHARTRVSVSEQASERARVPRSHSAQRDREHTPLCADRASALVRLLRTSRDLRSQRTHAHSTPTVHTHASLELRRRNSNETTDAHLYQAHTTHT